MEHQRFNGEVRQVAGGNVTNVYVSVATSPRPECCMTRKQHEAEVAVHQLLLRVLLADAVARQPASLTAVRDALERMTPDSPEGEAALRRWIDALRLPSER